jgi:membrane fusion protein, multidrug efflux system
MSATVTELPTTPKPPEPAPASPPPSPGANALRRLALPVMILIVASAFIALVVVRWDAWLGAGAIQSTNDAYIRAEMTRLSTRVAGAVKTVAVRDYQRVKAGDLLVEIDPADYEVQVLQAEACVAGARATLENLSNQVELQYATVAQAEAQWQSATARETQAQQEQQRQETLNATSSGTRQKLEQAVADLAKAQADVRASRAVIAAQKHQLEVLAGNRKQRQADLQAAQAALDAARLKFGYTRIVAPFDGVVGERQVQIGDYVNIGTNLITVVPLPNVYVTANYKETQLTRVKAGQPVDITVDTFPGLVLHGHVERIAPASGSQFALLPPDNATGNFTKVVQRIPVRISIDAGQPEIADLRPGMSVVTRIHADVAPAATAK